MYSVSEEYRQAIASDHVKSRVSGTMTLKNGTVYEISDANIQSKSLKISRRCTNNGKFNLGTAYMSQMNMTVLMDIDRYSVYGAKIKLSLFQKLQDDSEEEIKLGEFYVNTPNRERKSIAITAYDAMNKFDILLQEDIIGTPFELLTYLCSVCSVALGNTNAEIARMPNGTRTMRISPENLETCRDALAVISKMLAGYAIIDRNGSLTVKTFATASMGSITAGKREKSNIADYETYFVGVKGRFLINGEYQAMAQASVVHDTGILLDIGDIPIYQTDKQSCEAAIREIVDCLDGIRYTPCKVTMVADASLDPGDALTLLNVNNGSDSVLTIITAITWTHHASMEVTSDGIDTVTQSVNSNTVKMITALEKSADKEVIRYYRFTNAEEIFIADGDQKIITDIRFAALIKTVVEFKLEALVNIETTQDGINFNEANITVIYTLNDTQIIEYKPKETWVDGDHILHLLYTLELDTVLMQHFVAAVRMDGGSMTIGMAQVKSSMQGQGLAATDSWDGIFAIQQEIPVMSIADNFVPITTIGITDRVGVSQRIPEPIGLSEEIPIIQITGAIPPITMIGITDTVGVSTNEIGG